MAAPLAKRQATRMIIAQGFGITAQAWAFRILSYVSNDRGVASNGARDHI